MKELDPLILLAVFQEMMGPLLWILLAIIVGGTIAFFALLAKEGGIVARRMISAQAAGILGGILALVLMVMVSSSGFTDAGGPADWFLIALVFGLGTFAGTLAISVFTFGIVAKMLYESIETIDMGPFEAMEAMGANKFQAFWSACVPQILPVYLSHSLYCFEMNVRASAILGYVGAGGLGITINERIGWRDYEGLGMVLLTLFVVVVAIEFLSEYLRGKLS